MDLKHPGGNRPQRSLHWPRIYLPPCVHSTRPAPGAHPLPESKEHLQELRPQAEWIPIPIEAIIDETTFDAVRAQMALNIDRSPRNNKRIDYLLRLLTVCGLCGCHISATSNNGRSYYRCTSRRTGSKRATPHNDTVAVRHPKLDALVWDALVDLMDNPARLEEHLAKRQLLPEMQAPSADIQAHDKASAKLDAEEERLLDAYREKVIDLAQLKRQMGRLTEKRAHHNAVREALAHRTEPIERPRITRDMLGDLSARYRRAMANADFAARRQIVEIPRDRSHPLPRQSRAVRRRPRRRWCFASAIPCPYRWGRNASLGISDSDGHCLFSQGRSILRPHDVYR